MNPFRSDLTGLLALVATACLLCAAARAQSDQVGGPVHSTVPRAPRVRLDGKSPRIVQFQLRRLSTNQLLQIPRSADAPKYLPVYREILIRPEISPKIREESLSAIQGLSGKSTGEILLTSISDADVRRPESTEALIGLLLRQPQLGEQQGLLKQFADHTNATVRAAARLAQMQVEDVADIGNELTDQGKIDLLARVELLDAQRRVSLFPWLAGELAGGKGSDELEAAAMRALIYIPADPRQRIGMAIRGLQAQHTRSPAIAVLSSMTPADCSLDDARAAVDALYRMAAETPTGQRGDDQFLRLMECAGHLISTLPAAEGRAWRSQLARIAVRVIRVEAVFDQMRYDKPYFVVEQSEDFLLIFRNGDMMPHNLVITAPGALREIGLAANSLLATSATKKQYVPDSEQVWTATEMLAPHQEVRLTLSAPSVAGEYPFLCTFPNHWYRMYGVMLVVPDLGDWLQTPVPPADPLGRQRRFVQHWTVDDLDALLAESTPPDETTVQQGAAIFSEAGCIKCHRINCQGSAVGPALDGVLQRHNGQRRRLLREMVDPSYAVADEYANYAIQLHDGGIVSGLITRQTEKTVSVISNPEDPQVAELPRAEIDEIVRLNISLMPSGLLDQYTPDEVRAVLAFVERTGSPTTDASQSSGD